MGRPCGAKKFKNRTSDYYKKTHFQMCAFTYRPQGTHRTKFYMGAQLHSFRCTKAQKVALKFYKNFSAIVRRK